VANEKNLKPFKKGKSGNPAGYSRARRISDSITALIEEMGLDREFGITAIAMALGRKHMLKRRSRDPETGKEVWIELKPDYAWFAGLREWIEGKAYESKPPSEDARETKPRIKVPGRQGHKSRRAVKSRHRTKKPT
jgi:hypothetical protein